MRELPREGKLYRHFKGTLYRVICIARDSETLEEMVVYEDTGDTSKKYVRRLAEFMSETDHGKYPEVTQKYRFEEEDPGDEGVRISETKDLSDGEVPEELMSFLDAEDFEAKLDVLERIRGKLTEDMVSAIAMSLDTEVREGSLEDKYAEIRDYLLTTIRYEGARLRK